MATLDLSILSQFLAPEIWPGGRGYNDPERRLAEAMGNVLTQIITTININNANTNIYAGSGAHDHLWVIGHTASASTTDVAETTHANKALQVTSDGQLVACWKIKTAVNTWKLYLKKSAAPFVIWTNLAGDSQSPTVLDINTATAGNFTAPTLCETPGGDLVVAYAFDDGITFQVLTQQYLRTGSNWPTLGISAVLKSSSSTYLSDMINTGQSLAYIDYDYGNDQARLYYSVDGSAWSNVRDFRNVWVPATGYTGSGSATAFDTFVDAGAGWTVNQWAGFYLRFNGVVKQIASNTPTTITIGGTFGFGAYPVAGSYVIEGQAFSITTSDDQKRIVNMGGGRVLALFGMADSTGRGNIGWALSTDYGLNWPRGSQFGVWAEAGYPGDASGVLLPCVGGGFASGNMTRPGFGGISYAKWDAAFIAGTNRVGLVYRGEDLVISGSRTAGVYYCEFDVDTLTWTPQSDHVLLSPHTGQGRGVRTDPGAPSTASGIDKIAGVAVSGSEGFPRVLWVNQYQASGSDFQTVVSVSHRRLMTGGTPTNTAHWYAQKDVLQPLASSLWNLQEFTGAKQGVVASNGKSYFPTMLVRTGDSASGYGNARKDVLLKLFDVAALDAP